MISYKKLVRDIDLDKKIYIAFSGGLDSTVLLHLFSDLKKKDSLNIEAIYVNHNLSKENKNWENHCVSVCNELGLKLHIRSVDIKVSGEGLESAARKARYNIFEELLEENEQILIGHHSDDVAETFFLRLFRGTGVQGLEGPKIKRRVGKGYLIRPLLSYSKKELLKYANENDISFIEDSTNFEINQDRNFIRNKLIPTIEKRWINVSDRISRTSSNIGQRNELFEDLLKKEFNSLLKDGLHVKELKKLDHSIIKELIRLSIRDQGVALPNKKVTDEIIKTFISSNPGSKSKVSWSRADKDLPGGEITYKNGYIIISKG